MGVLSAASAGEGVIGEGERSDAEKLATGECKDLQLQNFGAEGVVGKEGKAVRATLQKSQARARARNVGGGGVEALLALAFAHFCAGCAHAVSNVVEARKRSLSSLQ